MEHLAPIVLGAALIALAACAPERDAQGSELDREVDRLARVVRDGDLVMRHASNFWSDAFRDVSQRDKRYSHIGIARREAGEVLVVHAVANDLTGVGRVQSEPLASFLHEVDELGVYRFGTDAETGARIATAAMRRLGVPFDSRFDLSTTDALYCTELVYQTFREVVGDSAIVPSALGRPFPVVALDDCYADPAFERIATGRRQALASADKADLLVTALALP